MSNDPVTDLSEYVSVKLDKVINGIGTDGQGNIFHQWSNVLLNSISVFKGAFKMDYLLYLISFEVTLRRTDMFRKFLVVRKYRGRSNIAVYEITDKEDTIGKPITQKKFTDVVLTNEVDIIMRCNN